MSRTERSKIKGRRSSQSTQGHRGSRGFGLSLPGSSTSAADEALLRGSKAREQPSQSQVGKLSTAKLKKDHPIHSVAPHARRSMRNSNISPHVVSDPQYRRRSMCSAAVFVPPARPSGCVPCEDMRAFPDERRKSLHEWYMKLTVNLAMGESHRTPQDSPSRQHEARGVWLEACSDGRVSTSKVVNSSLCLTGVANNDVSFHDPHHSHAPTVYNACLTFMGRVSRCFAAYRVGERNHDLPAFGVSHYRSVSRASQGWSE